MPRAPRRRADLETELAELRDLAHQPPDEATRSRIRTALLSPRSLVVAKAARMVVPHRVPDSVPVLLEALERFYRDPVKTDPGCSAKEALVEVLDALEHPDPEPFVAATRHVQMEPAWGPPVDTATHLRARGLAALANQGFPDLLVVAGPMLGDPQIPVRLAAADALSHHGDRLAAGCLLLAARRPDEDPGVRGACYQAALKLAPEWTLPVLLQGLTATDPESSEVAALVLGSSHRDDALPPLLEALETTSLAEEREPLLRALALHRSDRALDELASRLESASDSEARRILRWLAPRSDEERVHTRVHASVRARGSGPLEGDLATWGSHPPD